MGVDGAGCDAMWVGAGWMRCGGWGQGWGGPGRRAAVRWDGSGVREAVGWKETECSGRGGGGGGYWLMRCGLRWVEGGRRGGGGETEWELQGAPGGRRGIRVRRIRPGSTPTRASSQS